MENRIPVVYSKVRKVWGRAKFDTNTIHLHYKIKGKKHCEILVHEGLHILFPDLTEAEIVEKAILLTNTIWEEGYRRQDNSNDIPMQDGSL